MNQKKWWIGIIGGGSLLALVLGGLIYRANGVIDELWAEVDGIKSEIDTSRQLLTSTASLEREVIVLRETEVVIKEILPDEEDLNNFVRDLRTFEEDSEVRITGLKKKTVFRAPNAPKAAFDPVTYTLTLEGDAFQLMAFFDRIENHSRFMRVPSFKLSAASRRDVEKEGIALHKVQLEVTTYAYEPKSGAPPVKIEGYDRKRQFLQGEIVQSRSGLLVRTYDYRGARGRRDPWVDPRVPIGGGPTSGLTVEQQITAVENLVERTRELEVLWEAFEVSTNVIEEMTARADVESAVVELEVDLHRILEEGSVQFIPSVRRLELEVLQPLEEYRSLLTNSDGGKGPTAENLVDVLGNMQNHVAISQFQEALETFAAIEFRLEYVVGDPERESLASRIKTLANQASIANDFDRLKLDIRGRALQEGVPPVLLIGGMTLGEGDLVDNDLIIRAIRADEIEFIYRGVVLIRRL